MHAGQHPVHARPRGIAGGHRLRVWSLDLAMPVFLKYIY